MKTVTLLLAVLLCAALPGVAHGQCIISTSTYYSVSTSEAESGNPFGSSPGQPVQAHLIVSMLVDGSASMQMYNGGGGCPDFVISAFNANKQNVPHSPSVLNQIGSVGGWLNGPSVCAECWISYQTNTDSGLLNAGTPVTITTGATIQCGVAGQIFASPTSIFAGEIAYTRSVNTGVKAATFVLNGVLWNSWVILAYCNPSN